MIREYLGNSPRIKVLEFLIFNRAKSYGVKEILMGAKVKHRNLIIILNDMLKKDIIYIEKKLGKSNLYRINEFEPFAQSLIFAADMGMNQS